MARQPNIAMDSKYLSAIGVPFGGPAFNIPLPEEKEVASAKAAAAPKGKPKPAAAGSSPSAPSNAAGDASSGKNFLEKWIEEDLATGGRCHGKRIMTRFPPEPNGYLHIGHAKSILTNFGLAQKFGGQCNLRFDDTNPETEETEYVESIKDDVCWITEALELEQCKNGGKPWRDSLFYASDYFDKMHAFAVDLIKAGKAYVDSQTAEEVQKNRGGGPQNLPGVDSPFRNRSVEGNLKLFAEMQEGKHAEGSLLLRAKIDMSHPNMNMRDPPMYRIRFAKHHRTGDKWKVYPIYDFAHGNEDAIEGITHSICTLEFENHRALYDWFINNTPTIPSKPMQKEFARLEVEGAVTSKRKLLRLVKENKVTGWDDPRLLTVRGLKRRGVRPQGLKNMCDTVGVTDRNSTTPWNVVEECFREDLEPVALRRMAVLEPLLVEITTYKGEENIGGLTDLPEQDPKDAKCTRAVSFSSSIYIEQSDYQEDAPEGFFRLSKIGSEVKLRYSYVIKLEEVVKDKDGKVQQLKCSHDPATRDIMPSDRKPKVVHWVNAKDSLDAEVREINMLFLPMPDEMPAGKDFMDFLNPESWILRNAKVEKALGDCKQHERFQFERCGYFSPDYACYEKPKKLVFNRVVPLKESSAKRKMEGTQGGSRKEAQAAAAAEKERLQSIPPEDFFKRERGDEFSAYDETGLPTHNKDGTPVPKSAKKKLEKDLDKQKKLYAAWQATQKAPPKKEEKKDDNKKDDKKKDGKRHQEEPKEKTPAELEEERKKKMKKVKKEGGKRGVEIEGAADMGGLQFFCTSVDEPEGDMELLVMCLEAMNEKSDPTEEERKGGSGHIGKMIFSAGAEQLAVAAYVPEAKQGECECKDWLATVLALHGGKVENAGKAVSTGSVKTDPDKSIFPLKIRESMIIEANNFLRKRGLFPEDNGSDSDDMVFGDEDFPS